MINARRQGPAGAPSRARPAFVPRRVPLRLRIRAIESLGRLLAGGRSLGEAIEDLRRAARDRRLSGALDALGRGLRDGATMAQAAAGAPGLFRPADPGLLEVGERSGRLPEMLGRMASTLARRAEVRQRIARLAAYPVFLLAMAAVSLPLPCLFGTCGLSGYLAQAGTGLGLLALAVLASLAAPALAARLGLAAGLRRLAWHLPVARALYRPAVRCDTLQAASMALSAGLGLPETLALAALASGDPSAVEACREVARRIAAGSGLADAVGAVDLLDPDDLVSLAGGERSGDLDQVLARLADASLDLYRHRADLALRVAGWALLVAVMAALAARVLGQAGSSIGIPDDVLRELEKESRGVFQRLR